MKEKKNLPGTRDADTSRAPLFVQVVVLVVVCVHRRHRSLVHVIFKKIVSRANLNLPASGTRALTRLKPLCSSRCWYWWWCVAIAV